MTDFEAGVEFGRTRYFRPLVETLRIAVEHGEQFLNGTLAGLMGHEG